MKIFKIYFKIELKRLFNVIAGIIALLFFALSMYFLGDSSLHYKDELNKIEKFKQIEQAKVKKHLNYTIYGMQGIRILFVPPVSNIFFSNSGAFSDLSSTLDVGERLNIAGSYKGPDMFRGRRAMYADFSGMHLLFGSLLALLYGFLSFRNRGYLQILGSMAGFKKVYLPISAARFLLLCLYFIVVTASGLALVYGFGIRLTGPDYAAVAGYLGLWLLAALVIFSAGTAIGALRSISSAGIMLGITWIFFFYISVLIVEKRAEAASGKIKSIYQQENEKWDALMRFEIRYRNEVGKFKPEIAKLPPTVKMVDSFMATEYKEMQGLEKAMEEEMRDSKEVYEWWSLLSPGTILDAAACELSGQGYDALVSFYAYTQGIKDRFCEFYKNKKFYSRVEEKEVESFIKNEENIYYGRAELPTNMGWVLLELLVFSMVLQGIAYYSHKRGLAKVRGEMAAQWDPGSLDILSGGDTEGEPEIFQIEEEGYSQRIYNYLSGSRDFIYLCRAEQLPGEIAAGDFLELVALVMGVSPDTAITGPYRKKRIRHLKNLEKFTLMMRVTEIAEQAGKSHYLFNDVVHDMPVEAAVGIKKRMEELSRRGVVVILLIRSPLLNISEYENRYGIRKAPRWFDQVAYCAGILDM